MDYRRAGRGGAINVPMDIIAIVAMMLSAALHIGELTLSRTGRRNIMEKISHISPISIKKPEPYYLKDFFMRNRIAQRDIAAALGICGSHLSNEFCGYEKMPPHFDKKLKATAIFLSDTRRVRYPVSDKERKFCLVKEGQNGKR